MWRLAEELLPKGQRLAGLRHEVVLPLHPWQQTFLALNETVRNRPEAPHGRSFVGKPVKVCLATPLKA